jgi:alpha-ketoglutarate-dependent taurine dioxygenase
MRERWHGSKGRSPVGDLVMWDELATMHRGAGDYRPDERRIMLRTIVY